MHLLIIYSKLIGMLGNSKFEPKNIIGDITEFIFTFVNFLETIHFYVTRSRSMCHHMWLTY